MYGRLKQKNVLPKQTANSKTSVAVDFGGKRLRFWSRGFVCQTKKVNACGHIPVRDLTMAYSEDICLQTLFLLFKC